MKNIVIYGASGYVGQELLKLCANHPEVNISGLSANSAVGQDIDFELIKIGKPYFKDSI